MNNSWSYTTAMNCLICFHQQWHCHMTRWAVHMLHLKPFMYRGVSPSNGWPLTVRSNSGRVRHPNLCKECNFLNNENTSTHKWFKVKSHDKTITCYKLTCTYTHIKNAIILTFSYCAESEIPLHTIIVSLLSDVKVNVHVLWNYRLGWRVMKIRPNFNKAGVEWA